MSLDETKQLARAIADISNEQDIVKQNMSGDQSDAQLQIGFSESIVATGTITLVQHLFKTDSFIIDHPIYSQLDNTNLILDGGYQALSTTLFTGTF